MKSQICSCEKERNGRRREEERVKLANDIYQTWIVNECFNVLETLIYVFTGRLMMWQYDAGASKLVFSFLF